jgi:hypothetical protein
MTLITDIIRSMRDEPEEWRWADYVSLARPDGMKVAGPHTIYFGLVRRRGKTIELGFIARYRLRRAIRKWESRS